MKTYSKQEKIEMVLIIGECLENCLLASRVYAQRFPTRNHPNRRAFQRLLETFRTTGSVDCTKAKREQPVSGNEINQLNVLCSVIDNPGTSQRKMSRELGVSKRSIGRILKRHNLHPYHIQMHQDLSQLDRHIRQNFCVWVMDKWGEDENFFDFVLFTDESTFHNDGFVNRHNFHYYSDVNPNILRTVDRQHRWSVNVWGGIVGNDVIGPYFFDENLNGQNFLRFLRFDFQELLENIPLQVRQRMWLQLDGAPAHFHIAVRNFLNQRFENRWIGRGGPHNWPARSPDLTCVDFFLWGYVKNIVYEIPPTTRENMENRILSAFQTITPQMLTRVRNSFRKRVQLCIENDGAQVEHLLA